MVLLGELFENYALFEVDKLYRSNVPGSKYVPQSCKVFEAGRVFGATHRIDIYTKNKTRIYFMFIAAPDASSKALNEKANNLLTMLKAAQ